jgi:hypothetical protein
VFENRVLKKIYGAKRNKVTRAWRTFPDEELVAVGRMGGREVCAGC